MSHWMHLSCVSAIVLAVICRARHMTASTLPVVRLQHWLLAGGALASLVTPEAWRPGIACAAVLAFLSLSAGRWRTQAPAGTSRKHSPSKELS